MAAKRAERLVNLVIALLGTRQYVSAARIRATVPGYEADDGTERADEAFKRMFERDKADLREMGVPLETGRTSAFDTEDGYRIARADYELPELTLDGEEAAAVGLALRLWESAQMAGAAQSALVKLKAAGVDVDPARALPLRPRLDSDEPAFEPCYTAARDRRLVEFDYRRPDEGAPAHRRVQPWGVVAWHGRWYLVGHDLDRRAPRVFRLSRVAGAPRVTGPEGAFEPPPDLDLAALVAGQDGGQEQLVVVRARPGAAVGLRRTAVPLEPADDDEDGDLLQLRTTDLSRLADQLAAYGADVLVESPQELRDAVVERLTRLAAMGAPA
ncbi:helix-turn-helix transcriptional regulator [Trujillonella endophytica]|uniref:Transcriptional regulator n=1 Tax=Trujillonella endophytica TaxID=673521 RepID=A0A1H8T3G2_9ACTN|nr:WYL domain-containing protein [Trujillella endophytica]SEO85452.1 transcriptional regulator [Trujillella endophytica]